MARDMVTKKIINYRQLCVIVSAMAARDDGTAPTEPHISDRRTMFVNVQAIHQPTPRPPHFLSPAENVINACPKDTWISF